MNNTLNRKMFRKPGDSRQAAGILASSPELANVVQQRLPVRMAQGGMNTTSFTAAVQRAVQAGDRAALRELANPNNYGEAAKTQDGQNAIRMAAQAINRAASNNPPVQISTAPTVAVPDLIDKGIASVNEFFYGTDTKQTPIQTGLRAIDTGVRAVTSSAGNLMRGDFMRPVTDYLTTPQLKGVATEQSGNLTDPSMLLPQTGETPPPVSPLVSDALNYENMYGTGDLNLGETLAATTTPTQDKAAEDAGESTTTDGSGAFEPSKRKVATTDRTNAAIKKIQDNVANFTSGSFNQNNVKKLTGEELSNEAVLADLTPVIAELTDPEEVDIEAIDKKVNDLTGFDPKKAGKGKETAFWMSLMKAGLAMAAGESDNALTNIAKGLSYGLDSYGKDINNLNEQEREDRKERAALKLQMINSDRSYNLTMAGIKNTHEIHKADIQNQFKRDKADLGFKIATANRQERELEANIAQAQATLQLSAIKSIEDLMQGRDTIDLNRDKLAATIEAGKPDEIKLFKELGIIDNKGKATDFGIQTLGGELEVLNAVLAQAKTARTTGQAMTPERFAQEVLKTEDGRSDIASRMIRDFPQRYSKNNPPSLPEMMTYAASTTGGAVPAAVNPGNIPVGTRMIDPVTKTIVVKQADGTFLPEATGN